MRRIQRSSRGVDALRLSTLHGHVSMLIFEKCLKGWVGEQNSTLFGE